MTHVVLPCAPINLAVRVKERPFAVPLTRRVSASKGDIVIDSGSRDEMQFGKTFALIAAAHSSPEQDSILYLLTTLQRAKDQGPKLNHRKNAAVGDLSPPVDLAAVLG